MGAILPGGLWGAISAQGDDLADIPARMGSVIDVPEGAPVTATAVWLRSMSRLSSTSRCTETRKGTSMLIVSCQPVLWSVTVIS